MAEWTWGEFLEWLLGCCCRGELPEGHCESGLVLTAWPGEVVVRLDSRRVVRAQLARGSHPRPGQRVRVCADGVHIAERRTPQQRRTGGSTMPVPAVPLQHPIRALPPGAPGWASLQIVTPDVDRTDDPALTLHNPDWRWSLVNWDLGTTRNTGSVNLSYTNEQLISWFGQGTRFERPEAGTLTRDGRVMLLGQVADWVGDRWAPRDGQAWALLPRPGVDGAASWGHLAQPNLERPRHVLETSAAIGVSVTPDRILKTIIPRYQETPPPGAENWEAPPPFFDSAVVYEVTPSGGSVGVDGLARTTGDWAHAGHTWDEAGTMYFPMRERVGDSWVESGWVQVGATGASWSSRPDPALVISDRDPVTDDRYLTGDEVPESLQGLLTQYPTLHGWLEDLSPLTSTVNVTVTAITRVGNGFLLHGAFGVQPWNAGYAVGDAQLVVLGTHPAAILVSALPAAVQAALKDTPVTVTRVPTSRYWASGGGGGGGEVFSTRLVPPAVTQRPVTFSEHAVTLQGGTWVGDARPRSDPLTTPKLPNPGAALRMPAGGVMPTTVSTGAPFGPYSTLFTAARVHPTAAVYGAGKELAGRPGQFVQIAAALIEAPAYVSAQPRVPDLPETGVNVAQVRASAYTVEP